jgi:pimeloyl-ACP methyl ester carboxylesterase
MWRLLLLALLAGCVRGRHEDRPPMTFEDLAPGPVSKARVGDLDVAYVDVGSGPLVVLVHGLGEHLGYWDGNLPGLVEGGARVVALDLPGFGRSSKPAEGYGIAWQAAAVRGLLDAIAPGEPAVLVGHSMGGQIATRFALTWPERVRALVLVAPAGIERFGPGEAAWLKNVSTPKAFADKDEDELRAHYRRNVFHAWGPAAERHLAERVRLRAAPGFDAYIHAVVRMIHAMVDEPVADELHRVQAPVTVLFGERDGLIPNTLVHGGAPADVAAQARRLMPAARVDLLPDVGHMVQIEAPERTNRAILDAVRAAPAEATLP